MAEDEAAQALIFNRAFTLMSALDGVPESSDEIEDFYVSPPQSKKHELFSVQKHKAQGQKAWLAVLQIAKTKDQMKRVLDIMSTVIAPWFSNPEMLADFLTSSYDAGGSMSLLALSGVFYLIKERNLDYPSFYPKLYSLLDRDLLHSKHRSRFLRLMDTFLNSTHLPAALVASFIKRLARLALNAPPSAIVSIVPWMYNILKHHPQCTFMIHREVRDPELQKQIDEEGAKDPFDPEEADPMETGAIDSCLWEVVQLQSHYHPNVATIAKIMSEQFTKQAYNIEDFLDHSYATVCLPHPKLYSIYIA
jgi:U3 small nucleolar RNA-associated protein 19